MNQAVITNLVPATLAPARAIAVEVTGTGTIEPSLPGVSAHDLAAAFAKCREVTRSRARNFYYGLRLTPEPRRSAIFAVYSWMRAADDAVDEVGTTEARRVRLEEFRRTTDEVLRGDRDPRPLGALWVAFAATVRSYPVDPGIFREMLEGLEADLFSSGFDTGEELSRYCYCVAGTAGLACLSIWGLRPGADSAEACRLAVQRGEAFQRTNIIRDFAQDFDEAPPRVYLPAECFRAVGISHAELRSWESADRCEALIKEQAAATRGHYTASASLEGMIDPTCAPTLWAMTRIYSGLLSRIEARPRRIVDTRVRLASVQKASIALGAAVKARMGRW